MKLGHLSEVPNAEDAMSRERSVESRARFILCRSAESRGRYIFS